MTDLLSAGAWEVHEPVLPAEHSQRQKAYRLSHPAQRQKDQRNNRDVHWLAREFVGWDGEGVTREGRHDYVLLANSDGARLSITDGHLSTIAILEFLLTRTRKDTINVIYGASYDWNCWLADLTEKELRYLYDNQAIYWRGYIIKWRRGKSFWIGYEGRSALFYDVVSFFQTPFVKACDSYLGDEFIDRDLIVENKRLRSTFRAADLKEISRYNDAELVNIVRLMIELRTRLHGAGLKPSRWDGPGAIAVALMRRENVKRHMMPTPEPVGSAVRHAYFGGRFEVVRFGHYEGRAYEYDINSAYPFALAQLPSLAGGVWHIGLGHYAKPFAIYNYIYKAAPGSESLPHPFPRRMKDGSVVFGAYVQGWAWTPEYETALEYVRLYGGELHTIKTRWFEPFTDAKPFGFIPELFEQRRALKAAGDGAHVGIKLGLNSLYGKLAQQVGWKIDRDGNIRIPPYHQLDWAGYVTATCRSMVLRASLQHLDKIIAWETDAMFSTVPLPVAVGSGLGEWEGTEFRNITYLQSGMYFATTSDGVEVVKTRGIDKGTLSRGEVLEAMRRGDTHISAQMTRFIGIGAALQSRFDHWRKWETTNKNVSLAVEGKRIHVGCDQCETSGIIGLHSTIVYPAPGFKSLEYPVGWINPDPNMRELDDLRQGHYESEAFSD